MFQRNTIVVALVSCLIATASFAHESHHHGEQSKPKKEAMNHKQHQSKTGELSISDQWIRSTAPGAPTTAAYFVLDNHTNKDIALVDVKSDIAQQVEIHEHSMIDGLMKMQKINNVVIPKESSVMFKPGGYHIMFIGLEKPVAEGDSVNLTLLFDNNAQKTITVNAKKKANKKHGEHKGHH